MTITLTRRRFVLLSCMAGASIALSSAVETCRGSRRRLRVALVAGPHTRTDHLLAIADCCFAEIVGITGVSSTKLPDKFLLHCPTLVRTVFSPEAPEMLAELNVEAVVWLRETKSEPLLLQAIRDGKHILLESSLTSEDLAMLGSLRTGQIVSVMPRRLPVHCTARHLIAETANQVTIVRRLEPSDDLADPNCLHRMIQDEFVIANELLAGADLMPTDVALCDTPRGPIWSARFSGTARGERCVMHAQVVSGKHVPSIDTMTVQTRNRSVCLPLQARDSDATRLYFDHFVSAVILGDPTSGLGMLEATQAAASLITSTTLLQSGPRLNSPVEKHRHLS
jgi:hypothetical protein